MSRSKKTVPVLKLLAFVLTAVLIFLVFRDARLDEWATSLFFDGSSTDSFWPLEKQLWVEIAYKGGSILTAVWGLSVIICYLLGFWIESLKSVRTFCVMSFLLLALGPGLLVNAVFKDNWGRPRPRETMTFGGENTFQAPFVVSDQGGKSFPCGHCSVGFALCVVAYWARREQKKRWLFVGGWVAALLLGLYLGAARVAVGAHYLSDVLSSAWSVFLVAWLMDYLLPVKRPEETGSRSSLFGNTTRKRLNPWWLSIGGVAILFVFGGFALMAFPIDKSGVFRFVPVIKSESLRGQSQGFGSMEALKVEFSGDYDQIDWKGSDGIVWEPGEMLSFSYQLKGFGLPWSNLSATGEVVIDAKTETRVLLIVFEGEGFFKELEVVVSPVQD